MTDTGVLKSSATGLVDRLARGFEVTDSELSVTRTKQ